MIWSRPIRNLYLSNYSSSAENIVEPEQSGIDFGSLMPQIREIIAEAGLSDDEHAVDNSKWLVANQIPLTQENLQYLTDLQGLSDDLQTDHIDWNQIVDSMAKAIAAGKRPADASMITARRQMEEARLVMTSEASVAMEKAGVEMDLTPLADLVEDLKSQEREYYKDLALPVPELSQVKKCGSYGRNHGCVCRTETAAGICNRAGGCG